MGCLASRNRESKHSTNSINKSTYSWSEKIESDVSQFTLENIMGETIVRLPDSIPGRPFTISNCLTSNIFLFDHLDAVNVSDCRDCTIFIGPTKGSVILHNCSNCLIICASMQLRCRDCYDLVFSIFSLTNPSIESSHSLQFSCLSLYYPQLEEQFKKAGLCIFNNNWHQVYDFNAFDGDDNHWILSPHFDLTSFIEQASKFIPEITCESRRSVVPFTLGHRNTESNECNGTCCLVVLFSDGTEEERAAALIDLLTGQHSYQLTRTRRFIVSKILEEQVFQTENYSQILFQGPVIALEFWSNAVSSSPSVHSVMTSGTPNSSVNNDLAVSNNCCKRTRNLLRAMDTLHERTIYISDSPLSALEQVDLIFNSVN